MNISKYIDISLLDPNATESDIINLCNEAKKHNFYAVCINSSHVTITKQLLLESEVKICTTVGFPHGSMSTKAKVFEAENAIAEGADEIDMVINLGYLKGKNYISVLKDINDVKSAIGKTPLKVIIEISELSKNEIVKACEICLDAKVDFIKTSTGFSKSGATFTAVKIIKKIVKDRAKIKASGGIRDFETAVKYIESGADRIGTSTIIKTTSNTRQIRNSKVYKQYLERTKNTNTTEETVSTNNSVQFN